MALRRFPRALTRKHGAAIFALPAVYSALSYAAFDDILASDGRRRRDFASASSGPALTSLPKCATGADDCSPARRGRWRRPARRAPARAGIAHYDEFAHAIERQRWLCSRGAGERTQRARFPMIFSDSRTMAQSGIRPYLAAATALGAFPMARHGLKFAITPMFRRSSTIRRHTPRLSARRLRKYYQLISA